MSLYCMQTSVDQFMNNSCERIIQKDSHIHWICYYGFLFELSGIFNE